MQGSQLKVQPAASRRAQHRSGIACAQKQQFSSFDDLVQNSELPVLVDFYATWCGPCQVMSQVLSVWAAYQACPHLNWLLTTDCLRLAIVAQKVSTQMAGKVKFVKIDTDKYPKVASRYAIQVCSSVLALEFVCVRITSAQVYTGYADTQ